MQTTRRSQENESLGGDKNDQTPDRYIECLRERWILDVSGSNSQAQKSRLYNLDTHLSTLNPVWQKQEQNLTPWAVWDIQAAGYQYSHLFA